MKVSIITPSYNQGDFIEETIKSVISQAGDFELEYIITDGGSTDNTLQVIKKYDRLLKHFQAKCKKLTFAWISEKDRGQSHAINKGFKMATGEILNWLCSDDVLEQGALQAIADRFQKDASVVFGDAVEIDAQGRKTGILKGRSFSREDLIRRWDRTCHTFWIMQPTVFFKKALLKEFGYLNEKNHLAMDYELYLKMSKRYRFSYMNNVLARSRRHHHAKSVQWKGKQFRELIRASRKYWKENYLLYVPSYYFYKGIKMPLWKLLKSLKQ